MVRLSITLYSIYSNICLFMVVEIHASQYILLIEERYVEFKGQTERH